MNGLLLRTNGYSICKILILLWFFSIWRASEHVGFYAERLFVVLSRIRDSSSNAKDLERFHMLLYNWENYFVMIGLEQANLSLIFNLHYNAN